MKQSAFIAIGLLMCIVVSIPSTAADRGKFGVGFQSSFPAWGLSGMYDLNRDLSLQAILGFLGDLNTYAGRGVYRFHNDDAWNAYGYGMLGLWTHTFLNRSYSAVGFGLGAGIEYDWRAFDENLPPLFWNLELGLGFVNLDYYNFSTFMFGVGVHYRF